MYQFIRGLPLPTKLLLIAAVPVVYIAFLTARLYNEKKQNVEFVGKYLDRVGQSAAVTRLIDELQQERYLSFENVLNRTSQDSMIGQRKYTDSALTVLKRIDDYSLRDFPEFTFLNKLDSIRTVIDSGRISTNSTIHFYSSTIFRLNTLNRPPSIHYEPLADVYQEMHFQRLLSDIITYQGIINANIYTYLYTRQYGVEILLGTLGTYDVYKTFQKELEIKSTAKTHTYLKKVKQSPAIRALDRYLEQTFSTFRFDTSITYRQWRMMSQRAQKELREIQMSLLEKVEYQIRDYYKKEESSQVRTLVYLIILATLLAFQLTFVLAVINQSLKELKIAALRMANGETGIPLKKYPDDAIGSLCDSIRMADEKNTELALAANHIGEGNFQNIVKPRGPQDHLGNAIVLMQQNLRASTAELERSREEFKALADFVPMIVWTARPDGFTDYYNKRWYEVTGAKPGFGDQSFIPILHPDDVGRCLRMWHHAVETGEPYVIEYRFWDVKTHNYRWYLGRAVPVKDETETVLKWFGTATDIHDQKIQKEKLEELVSQRTLDLKRSNEDLQQFAHVASHDLKEPVRKIRTFSSRLSEEFGNQLPDKGKTYLDKIQASSERMSNMIDSILSYSMMNATESGMETIHLNLMMEGIMSDLELLIVQKDAKIEFQNLPKIKGIPTLIYQLFYNLVSNALKFSRTDITPHIQIRSRLLPEHELEGLQLKKGVTYVEISVSDNGIGFSQEFSEKVFHIFTRLNSRHQYEGTGLGLALCRKIVHRHGGTILASSEENKGATFRVILPVEGKAGGIVNS